MNSAANSMVCTPRTWIHCRFPCMNLMNSPRRCRIHLESARLSYFEVFQSCWLLYFCLDRRTRLMWRNWRSCCVDPLLRQLGCGEKSVISFLVCFDKAKKRPQEAKFCTDHHWTSRHTENRQRRKNQHQERQTITEPQGRQNSNMIIVNKKSPENIILERPTLSLRKL